MGGGWGVTGRERVCLRKRQKESWGKGQEEDEINVPIARRAFRDKGKDRTGTYNGVDSCLHTETKQQQQQQQPEKPPTKQQEKEDDMKTNLKQALPSDVSLHE